MDRVLLASLTLLPAIPGAIRFARTVRARSARWSRSVITWGALTMIAGAAVYAAVALSVFPEVARVGPEEKANLMSIGLARGSLALWTGLVVGGSLCVLGGITRSLFKAEIAPS
jgi:hypothetical protein